MKILVATLAALLVAIASQTTSAATATNVNLRMTAPGLIGRASAGAGRVQEIVQGRGGLVWSNSTATLTLSTSYGIVTNADVSSSLRMVAASTTAGTLTCTNAGVYLLSFSISGWSTATSGTTTYELFDGATGTGIRAVAAHTIDTNLTVNASGLYSLSGANVITLKAKASASTPTILTSDGQVTVLQSNP